MKLVWEIAPAEIDAVKAFFEKHRQNRFVQNRLKRNVEKARDEFSKEVFWYAMLSCLLTTQQRSGPNSSVTRFISQNPFPLSYSACKKARDLAPFIERALKEFGGIRFAPTISKQAKANLSWLEKGEWTTIEKIIQDLLVEQSPQSERKAAEIVMKNLEGFGPKQARNLLQAIGIAMYEIPIDSRIVRWLNDFGFPLKLTATALADSNYYNFVLDGVQKLCAAAGIYPCLLDAAIFSSTDGEWPEGRIIW